MRLMREAEVQAAVLLAIGALPGVYAVRTAAAAVRVPDGRGGVRIMRPLPPGWPDITAIVAGWAVAVECKAPGLERRDGTAPLRESQQRVRAAWEAAGGVWITATSAAQVVEVVEELLARGGPGEPR